MSQKILILIGLAFLIYLVIKGNLVGSEGYSDNHVNYPFDSYPKEFGEPFSMAQVDKTFGNLPFFKPIKEDSDWNIEAIPGFLEWHKSTKSIHAYVIGGAVYRRNEFKVEPKSKCKLIRLRLKLFYRYYFKAYFNRLPMLVLIKFYNILKLGYQG